MPQSDEEFIIYRETRMDLENQPGLVPANYIWYTLRCRYCDAKLWAVVRHGNCQCCGGPLREAWVLLGWFRGKQIWVRPDLLFPESYP